MLSSLGFDSHVVSDGAAAVDALAGRPAGGSYVAVLMDCHMPVMNGFDATVAIREAESGLRRTPVVAMTASVAAEDRERCLLAGMDDVVSKPVEPDALRRALAGCLRPVPPVPVAG